jgi:hypothetical protein
MKTEPRICGAWLLPEPQEERNRRENIKPLYVKRLAVKPVVELFTRLKPIVVSAQPKPPR